MKSGVIFIVLSLVSTRLMSQTPHHTLFVDEKCAVFVHPENMRFQESKSEYSEEGYDMVADDIIFYVSEARDFLESRGLETIDTDKRKIRFRKSNGQIITLDVNKLVTGWGLIWFDPGKDPEVADLLNIGSSYNAYFNH